MLLRRGWWARMFLGISLGWWALGAQAAPIPWRAQQHIDLPAVGEPLNIVLGRLFTLNGLSVSTSPAVATAKVNGRLQGRGETIFRELVDTYGLSWYFDGSTVHVTSLNENESRILQVAPSDTARVERTLREMGLWDARFQIRLSPTEGHLYVSGPPRYVSVVEEVATRVASSPSGRSAAMDTRVFRLRHARAADTVVNIGGKESTIPGVARLLNEVMGSSVEAAPAVRSLPMTQPGLRGSGLTSVGREADPSAASPGGGVIAPVSAAQGRQAGDAREATRPPVPAAAPPQQIVARADSRINAVIVRDTPERMAGYERLIGELDVSMPLLEIEATVIDISQNKSKDLGVDWRLHGRRADVVSSPNGLAGTGRGGGTNEANDLIYSLPARSSGAGLVGTLLFGNERRNFMARLNALAQNGDANLIAKPRVLTMNNTEAVLQSSQDFYVRVAGREQVDLFNVSSGLMLRVTPSLIEDPQGGERVKLTIHIEDGNADGARQVDQIPVVNRNAIATQAVVGDGHSLLIGGYTIEEKTDGSSGVPGLSSVPGLRWLFGQTAQGSRRVERMFMITPRLLRPDEVQPDAASVVAEKATMFREAPPPAEEPAPSASRTLVRSSELDR